MSQISTEIGKQIRTFRKKRKMTLEALAAVICKSKSTVSKYENGEIPVDIETGKLKVGTDLQTSLSSYLHCLRSRYRKPKIPHRIFIGDPPDDPGKGLPVRRILPVLHPASQDTAEDPPEILVPGIG